MSVLLEAPLNFTPRPVELYRLLLTATNFVRVRASNLLPVKLACLFQNLQVID